jgi:proline iminopeptidase
MPARERLIAFRRSLGRIPRLEERRVKVRGVELAAFLTPKVAGATPLVCVNGGLLFDHTLLCPALAPLARRRQLVFYDQRGRGASEAPRDPAAARIEDDAADLGNLRVALGISRWDVLGHSWGAGIAILGTERDGEGTKRLALIDPVGATGAWRDSLIAVARERLSPKDRALLDRFDRDMLSRPDPGIHSSLARALHPAWFADPRMAEFIPLPRSTSETGAAISARLWRDGYDWSTPLRAVEPPSVVVHGERDLLPRSIAAEVASMMRHATLAPIQGAGHMPFLETPQPFFELLEAFLEPP